MRVDQLIARTRDASNVVVVCGAGISTASGAPDFKTLYRKDPKLSLALDRKHFARHTASLARFLMSFSSRHKPGEAHHLLARLEDSKKLLRCYTMNLDGLEERAVDSSRVRCVHGKIDDPARCGKQRVSSETLLAVAEAHNGFERYRADHGCNLRPGFVLYGDSVRHLDEMSVDLKHADLILVMGTRLNVEPVAGLVRGSRHKVIGINNEPIDEIDTVVGSCEEVCARILG